MVEKRAFARMRSICILLHLLGTEAVQRNDKRECDSKEINVVSFVNSDFEVGAQKKSLEDIQRLAVLANDPRAALPSSFTICSDIMSVFSTKMNFLMFFNLLGSTGNRLLPAVMFDRSFYTTRVAGGQIPTVFPNQWVRSCMAIDTYSGMIQWVVDGNLVENFVIELLKDSKTNINLKGKIILGAIETSSGFWRVYSNKLTNLNIFSGLLPVPDMQQRTKGDDICLKEGDYLAWSEMDWDLRGGAVIEKIRPEELKTKPMANLYSALYSRWDCTHLCENLGSQMPSLSSEESLGRLQDFCGEKMKDIPHKTWLAVDDIDQEGEWRDSFTGQPLNYTPPWADTQPNGGTRQNCANLIGCRWIDDSCDWKLYCLCESEPRPKLKLLGLCDQTLIDRDYQPQNDVKDIETLKLVGHSTSIDYDHKKMLWMMNVVNSNVTGRSTASHESVTLGKSLWTIVGDRGCNKESHSYKVELKMSGCKNGNFTCYDGQCISMAKRCDQVPNCRDHSDEKDCNVLVLEEGYNKRVPPVGKSVEDKLTPVPVRVSLTLLKVVDIKEEDYSIELQIQINIQWKEIRATYHNLKPETYLNALSLEEITSLWLPLVVYTNTDQHETTRLGDGNWEWSTYVSVKREGNFTRSGYDVVDETELFKGNENTLIMTQSYTHEFQCSYQLGRYPFDIQVLNAKLISLFSPGMFH